MYAIRSVSAAVCPSCQGRTLYWRRGSNKTIMALFGRIDEFRDEAENWTQYHERLEQFCIANAIDEDKQRAVLLSVCGAKTYSLIRSLLAPICEILERHHCPRPSVIVQRYKFNMCVRNQGYLSHRMLQNCENCPSIVITVLTLMK